MNNRFCIQVWRSYCIPLHTAIHPAVAGNTAALKSPLLWESLLSCYCYLFILKSPAILNYKAHVPSFRNRMHTRQGLPIWNQHKKDKLKILFHSYLPCKHCYCVLKGFVIPHSSQIVKYEKNYVLPAVVFNVHNTGPCAGSPQKRYLFLFWRAAAQQPDQC